MTKSIYILNGPNLNMLGRREPGIYGTQTLDDVQARCDLIARELGGQITFMQSNHEGVLIDLIHDAVAQNAEGIIINPGALTHTSVGVLDALNIFAGTVVEVHISQVHKRETFRAKSYVSLRADAVMAGFGTAGYEIALRYMLQT